MILHNRKGFTLADIILILIVVAIMAVSGLGFYSLLFQQQQRIVQQMTGINLVMAQIEDLLAEDYSADDLLQGSNKTPTISPIPDGYTSTSYTVEDRTYNGMSYKRITATTTTPAPVSRTIQLIGFKVDQ
ncbi:MAG: hypothetical protein WC419_06120 [Candidatus Omnitrophota bacterium]|jgi:predicted PurR-regulated permease PerM